MGVYRHCCCMHRWRWSLTPIRFIYSQIRNARNCEWDFVFFFHFWFQSVCRCQCDASLSRYRTLSLTSYSMQFNYAIFPQVDNFPDQRWCSTLNKNTIDTSSQSENVKACDFYQPCKYHCCHCRCCYCVCAFLFSTRLAHSVRLFCECATKMLPQMDSANAHSIRIEIEMYVNAGKTMHLSLITHILNTMCGC